MVIQLHTIKMVHVLRTILMQININIYNTKIEFVHKSKRKRLTSSQVNPSHSLSHALMSISLLKTEISVFNLSEVKF